MTATSFAWNRQSVSPALQTALETLGVHYPLAEGGEGKTLRFVEKEKTALLGCRKEGDEFVIEHGNLAAALRGVGHALAGQERREAAGFPTLGIMLDCSRNAVMTVPYIQRWLRQLALLGYNRVMLYTEDTYELPDEPYFGHMRGGYSAEEIRAIDNYAALLGIEVIGCIQTLGHLEQVLKWTHYRPVMDTRNVLMVGEEKSYELIEKMIRFWERNLRSRRLHVGMDEAHDMGRGRYLDRKGYKDQFEIFQGHLARVDEICRAQGLKAMIWSDMYFRMSNPKKDYYDRESVIPEFVKEAIPATVDLVYWDYTSTDESFYREWIRRHRELGHEPVMASGIWTWARFWYDHPTTRVAVEPCLAACRKEGVSEVFFTMWGDGGGYCEYDSALAGVAWGADLAYGGTGEEAAVSPLLRAVAGEDYAALLRGSRIVVPAEGGAPEIGPTTILWDDPLLGIGWQGAYSEGDAIWRRALAQWKNLQQELEEANLSGGSVDHPYLRDLVQVLVAKTEFQLRFIPAYNTGDRAELSELRERAIPAIKELLRNLAESFRRQWLRRNKPFGMEVIQIRFGAMAVRWDETDRRIGEYLAGEKATIPELDARKDNLPPSPIKYFYWLTTGSANI